MKKFHKLLMATIVATVSGVAGTIVLMFQRRSMNLAETPTQLSPKDWKQALLETKNALGNKNLPIYAAGVTYFSTLAFFPLVAAAVAIAGFVIDADQIQDVAASLNAYLPKDIASLVTTQLQNVSDKNPANILVAVFAILLSVFSVAGAVQNMMNAINVAYGVKESRNFIKLKLISFVLTLGMILLGLIVIPVILVSHEFLLSLGIPDVLASTYQYVRWIILALIVTVALAVFYRYAPDRKNPKWQWVSWGAVMATILWLLGTVAFFIYAQYFAGFSDSYSLFAGIIVLMTWLNISAFIVILGAEVNHRLENKTDEDVFAN